METIISDIPVIKRHKAETREVVAAASCCTLKNKASVCCTPSETKEDNGGACSAQPADGSACCDK